jgi:hypothetical protein
MNNNLIEIDAPYGVKKTRVWVDFEHDIKIVATVDEEFLHIQKIGRSETYLVSPPLYQKLIDKWGLDIDVKTPEKEADVHDAKSTGQVVTQESNAIEASPAKKQMVTITYKDENRSPIIVAKGSVHMRAYNDAYYVDCVINHNTTGPVPMINAEHIEIAKCISMVTAEYLIYKINRSKLVNITLQTSESGYHSYFENYFESNYDILYIHESNREEPKQVILDNTMQAKEESHGQVMVIFDYNYVGRIEDCKILHLTPGDVLVKDDWTKDNPMTSVCFKGALSSEVTLCKCKNLITAQNVARQINCAPAGSEIYLRSYFSKCFSSGVNNIVTVVESVNPPQAVEQLHR